MGLADPLVDLSLGAIALLESWPPHRQLGGLGDRQHL